MTHNQAERDASATIAKESAANGKSRGTRALVGAAIAIVGVLAAANPQSAVLRAVHHALPQLADAIPTLITACGAIVAAFSQPPTLVRRISEQE